MMRGRMAGCQAQRGLVDGSRFFAAVVLRDALLDFFFRAFFFFACVPVVAVAPEETRLEWRGL